ncbi:phosphatidate phosphatase LPIN3 isoform X2 [Chrysoperla carnea]|uniref:phosphatidate phosphatase LPIN3 isoform X2 n=1 Tax=Chrysoperla carnea TaxID=189513 RepID=UPI001D07D63C|nr:phosphatidate phosphatase LPIN3 isoform X2 [Chrysoperla carnea]
MSVIGRVFSNFRDFYNEINAATLTGAIDVIVVEQPDGTFTCSPFHVRFGKLGVLRSREKVVDIEINGQPQDIHMKLGDSGEAFFVEETDESEDVPDPWATSPIPMSELEELYTAATADKPRRKSIDLGVNKTDLLDCKIENEVNDYSQRRNTGGNERDYTTQKREFLSRQIGLGNIPQVEQSLEDISTLTSSNISINISDSTKDDDHIFQMDNINDPIPEPIPSPAPKPVDVEPTIQPKIFSAETVNADQVLVNKFSPIKTVEINHTTNVAIKNDLDLPIEKTEPETKNGKKRRRKKSVMKKKNSQRKTAVIENNTINSVESKDVNSVPSTVIETSETKMSDSSTDKSILGTDESEDVGIDSETTPTTRPLNRDPDFHFFSDTELTTANSANASRPSTPVQSDTEFEFSQRKAENEKVGQSWAWGQLPSTAQNEGLGKEDSQDQNAERNSMLSGMFSFMKQSKRMRHSKDSEGIYLADLSSGNLDPEVTALYFPRKHSKQTEHDNDCESGNGPSLPQSPNSVEGAKSIDSDFDDATKENQHKYFQDISLSLCGWQNPPTPDIFLRHIIPFSDLCNNPSLLESVDLVVRINGKYYNWKTAIPIIISVLIYQRPLPQSTIEQLCNLHMPESSMEDKSKPEVRSYSWWNWRRSKSSVDATTGQLSMDSPSVHKSETKLELELQGDNQTMDETTPKIEIQNENDPTKQHEKSVKINENIDDKNTKLSHSNQQSMEEAGGYSGSQSSEDSDQVTRGRDIPNMKQKRSDSEEKYRKTLRLSSDQIKSLDLNEGVNEVEFSVTTAYQGTTRCTCHIYRWRYDDKIVISDIDGTITKSDVLGHILPIVGKDWAQNGVAQLFTKIKNNGYKLLYLSARAIGQAKVTREYLRSIKQGDLSLPDGPILLNPTSLMSAFHREVIEKKPELFKIQCLSDIRALFPDTNPFYAGYGNRINDVWAYRAVGIPIVRIFTINHKGELKHELTKTFQSSYSNMSYIVDQLFPPLLEDASDYSQFVYWREPVPIVDDVLPELK